MLKGYKTYVVGVVAIISTVASYLVGDLDIANAAQLVLSAVLGMTVRNAINS
jgi:hypothetical protein